MMMVEAQHAVINHSPDKSMMTLSFDRSVGQFRRLMAALIKDEATSTQGKSLSLSPAAATDRLDPDAKRVAG